MMRHIIISATLSYCAWLSLGLASAEQLPMVPASPSLPVVDLGVTASNSALMPFPDLTKRIDVDLGQQTLSYYLGGQLVHTIKISSGIAALPTPTGTFSVLSKIPVKEYIGRNLNGTSYDFKNTKWNLNFSTLGYYIHGAYWHNNFGHPMSHGCINVSYADIPELYNFADVGTQVIIHQ